MTQLTFNEFVVEEQEIRDTRLADAHAGPRGNAMLRIAPYWHHGTWAFDDDAHGLLAEPFVCGAEKMIDHVVVRAGIDLRAARQRGMRLTFSTRTFPGVHAVAHRVRPEAGGTWYHFGAPAMEGWLCPAMFHYFAEAPEEIHIRAELADGATTARGPMAGESV
jgi:hypothetical protein